MFERRPPDARVATTEEFRAWARSSPLAARATSPGTHMVIDAANAGRGPDDEKQHECST